jgi:hypothetical protein
MVLLLRLFLLPEWLESVRKDLGKVLPKVNLPEKKKKEQRRGQQQRVM